MTEWRKSTPEASLERLVPLVDYLAVRKLLPNVSRWVLHTVEQGYRGIPPPPFNGVNPTLVSPEQALVIEQEVSTLLRKEVVLPLDKDSGSTAVLHCSWEHRRSLGGGRGGGGHCPPRSEPIDFVRSINTKIFSHCLILFALSYFNEYVKAKLFVINVKKNLSDQKNQKLAPICDVSGQIFRSFHTAHRKRFDCTFIRREDRGHLRKSEKEADSSTLGNI